MPTTVRYEHTFDYRIGENNKRFPGFLIRLKNRVNIVDTDTFLDSGAEYSLFNGGFATAIGLSLLDGVARTYRTANKTEISARLHRVALWIPELGEFTLTLGFSLDDITRNILGRDFFSLVRIGFDEREQLFHVGWYR